MQYSERSNCIGTPVEYNGSCWYRIPGYNYWVSANGKVTNQMGHLIKIRNADKDPQVELYRYGQREKHYVSDLMRKAGVPFDKTE